MSDMNIMPFGTCLSDLLAKHNLSAATVSRMLGHKSRTTLRRILTDQANAESIEKFLHEFLAAQLIPLSPTEEQTLRQSLEASRIGLANYRARVEMGRLMCSSPNPAPRTLYLNATQEGTPISLDHFFRQLLAFSGIRMLIINNVPVSFFEMLSVFLTEHPHCQIDVQHYFFLNDDLSRTVRFISTTLPILCSPCYRACTIPYPPPEQSQFSTLTSSIVACQAASPDGQQIEYQLGFTAQLQGQLLTFPGSRGIYEFWENMISPSMPLMRTIKTKLPSPQQMDSYLELMRLKRSFEEKRAIYMLNPVFCLSFIPPSIIQNYIATTYDSDTLPPDKSAEFLQIHEQRFRNIYEKKRVSHILAPLRQLRHFAQTGVLADPIFRARPFTVAERRQILTYFRDQSRDNPYFNIYFLKNDSVSLNLNATCCDPTGVIIHSCRSDCTDVLISQDDFTTLFSQFFRETLLSYHALSVSAGVSVLNSLIDELSCDDIT